MEIMFRKNHVLSTNLFATEVVLIMTKIFPLLIFFIFRMSGISALTIILLISMVLSCCWDTHISQKSPCFAYRMEFCHLNFD